MGKTAAERAADYRERMKREGEEPALVAVLRGQVADLQRRLDASEERHKIRDERDVTRDERFVTMHERVTNGLAEVGSQLAILASGLGGLGGLSSGSPSPLRDPEKPSKARLFQDLNGETRGRDVLANGASVPGALGDETPVKGSVTETVTDASRVTNGVRGVLDSKRAETLLKQKPLRDPEMVEKAASESRRLQAELGSGK